jgi:UDP-glucose 4-epimerase
MSDERVASPRVAVTGNLGLIGARVCDGFAARGWYTVGVDKRFGRSAAHHHIVADLSDGPVDADVVGDLYAVVHLAAEKRVDVCEADPVGAVKANVIATQSALRQAEWSGARRFVYASSAAVHGDSVYGHTKHQGELLVRSWTQADPGRSAFILRIYNVWDAADSRTFPGAVAEAAAAGRTITINGDDYDTRDGTPERNWVDVGDVARAVEWAARSPIRQPACYTYAVSTEASMTVREVCVELGAEYAIGPRRGGDIGRSIPREPKLGGRWCRYDTRHKLARRP